MQQEAEFTIVVIIGVSGSGKTTVGRELAAALGWPFYEGDDFHPSSNINKMSQGRPLDDDDRWPWLREIRRLIERLCDRNQSAVISCSALKQAYRDQLKQSAAVQFVYLQASPELIHQRLAARQRHFMPPALIESQFDALEAPQTALVVSAHQSVSTIVGQLRQALSALPQH